MNYEVLKNLSYGMYIIGAKNTKNVGCVVNTVFQITSDPVMIAVSLNKENETTKTILETKKFSVSILNQNTKIDTIGTFGYKTSKECDKYEFVEYEEILDVPVLKDTNGYLICEVVDTKEVGTHIIFICKVVKMDKFSDNEVMTYAYYQNNLKGKSPKNAPTYIKEETKKSVWKCKICGYEAEMDELPSDYRCPICGRPATDFERIEK